MPVADACRFLTALISKNVKCSFALTIGRINAMECPFGGLHSQGLDHDLKMQALVQVKSFHHKPWTLLSVIAMDHDLKTQVLFQVKSSNHQIPCNTIGCTV